MIVLTEAWLGLDNISINKFAINGYTTYSTINNKNQNDDVVVYLGHIKRYLCYRTQYTSIKNLRDYFKDVKNWFFDLVNLFLHLTVIHTSIYMDLII